VSNTPRKTDRVDHPEEFSSSSLVGRGEALRARLRAVADREDFDRGTTDDEYREVHDDLPITKAEMAEIVDLLREAAAALEAMERPKGLIAQCGWDAAGIAAREHAAPDDYPEGRICPQDGGVCWGPCDVDACRARAEASERVRREQKTEDRGLPVSHSARPTNEGADEQS
jgi:hypothetical protein